MLKYSNNVLLKSGGLMWLAVGLMLSIRAMNWAVAVEPWKAICLVVLGILLGILKYKLIFGKLTHKYIARVNTFSEKQFILNCFAPKTWIIIFAMSFSGVLLRSSSIPRIFLISPYLMMALCLLIGGYLFLKNSNNG